MDGASGQLQPVRFVQTFGISGQTASVAKESDIECAAEHAFIGAEPLKAFLHRNRERLVRDRAFRGPQPSRLNAKDALVILTRPAQLLARIIRLAKRAAR